MRTIWRALDGDGSRANPEALALADAILGDQS